MSDSAVQKFSLAFSCADTRRSQKEGPDPSPQPQHERPVLRVEKVITDRTWDQTQEKPKLTPNGQLKPAGEHTKPQVAGEGLGALLSRKVVFEKFSVKDSSSVKMCVNEEGEEQRPGTKRQLSLESANRTVTVVKKREVRREPDKPKALPGQIETQRPGQAVFIKRKLRKDLFSSSEVFRRVDTDAVKAGKELKEKCVFDIQTVAQRVTQGAKTELERLRAIWVWLCHNIDYDVTGYLGQSKKLCSPEEVIAAGRGLCCGYSSLCTELCRVVGIECLEVPGHSKGIGHRRGRSLQGVKSDHLWNAVCLGGQWYLLDACWGAGRVDMDTNTFINRFDDFYFLTEPEDFIDSHFPDQESWQLLATPISLEEFERRVFKTSSFYTLGLTLLQPKHWSIVTEDGEATVSLGSSRSVSFTYEITRLGVPQQDLQGGAPDSSGLLTVSQRGMKLKLIPPAKGSYDIKLFARPEKATTPFSWVCSFTLACQTPKASEEMPQNPFLSWGLQAQARSLGVTGTSLGNGSQVIVVDAGMLELVLQTSRSLMVLCDLVHPGLDPDLSKRCLATQIESHRLTVHVLCPSRGFYRLSVFVRDYEMPAVKFQNAANFLLHCKEQPVSVTSLFPPGLGSSCGPGIRTADAGLSKFSHTGALVSTTQGKVNITFHTPRELDLHVTLSREETNQKAALSVEEAEAQQESWQPPAPTLARHLFLTYTDSKVTVSANLPDVGVYRLGLYGRTSPEGDFSQLCDYILRNSCERRQPPFPTTYSAWTQNRGSVLFEPRSGLLEAGTWVCFRVRVPGARRVVVVAGDTRTELKTNKSRVWEAEVFSGAGKGLTQIKLAADTGESADMAVMMTYNIQGVDREQTEE
ncbi:hypothetical protein DPEC_G00313350 [Dallia pectoralis]|uniref:Uncharacterized protein n=1 Tax=Dallia pectoralis TaxID=75939 RepID=A0ACC2FBV0_DALPE|nr:hypothetical protein DPEC_G00313350 [Dallia pectoralis]